MLSVLNFQCNFITAVLNSESLTIGACIKLLALRILLL